MRRCGRPPGRAVEPPAPATDVEAHGTIALLLAAIVTLTFGYALWEMQSFNSSSRLLPLLAVAPGLPLTLWLLVQAVRDYAPVTHDFNEHRVLIVLLIYALLVWAVGWSLPTVALLFWMLRVCAGMRWWTGLVYGLVIFASIRLLFHLLRGDVPSGALLPLS